MIIKATEQQENKMVKNNRQMWTANTEHVFDFDCGFQLICPMSKAEGTGKQKIPERAKVRMRPACEAQATWVAAGRVAPAPRDTREGRHTVSPAPSDTNDLPLRLRDTRCSTCATNP